MSKEPQVGDIWQSTRRNAQKIYITHVMGRVYCITEQGVASTRFFSDFGKTERIVFSARVKQT